MSDVICITNRTLCREAFLVRIEKIARAHPKALVLREKDLPPENYASLAQGVMEICARHGTACILHGFASVARSLGCASIHLPLPLLRRMTAGERREFTEIGSSCHSVEEALEAEALGCTYIAAGHVFDTACKKGLPGRGLAFLRSVCDAVSIPVHAIGGIGKEKYPEVRKSGAAGACIMRACMTCDDVTACLQEIEHAYLVSCP